MTAAFFAPYIEDEPVQNRSLQNQFMAVCAANVKQYAQEAVQKYAAGFKERATHEQYRSADRRLRIGYLSSSLWQHSVGWLARWLIKNHDRDRFSIYGYFLDYRQGRDPLQEWYLQQMDHYYLQGVDDSGDALAVCDRIFQDEIDILIDLDSITLDTTCEIMAIKPAPVQATWLGLDASGLPTIDYFIADPYSLPAEAEQYYAEKIWRLPHTFIAVDGFESAVPTLRRQDLGIPADAVVYLTAQTGFKRHPNTIQLQLEILKAVPNSYLAIKGMADRNALNKLFTNLATEMGISGDRLVSCQWCLVPLNTVPT
jgi:predicted O-linked N-acetylglucosamine transferase (SPINDLY family)